MPVETTMPAIIITHVSAAAAGRRAGATRAASNASSDVPAAPTPMPIRLNAITAMMLPSSGVAIRAVAYAASSAPAASAAMPAMIHGVRRAPRSEPWPQRARDSCTA